MSNEDCNLNETLSAWSNFSLVMSGIIGGLITTLFYNLRQSRCSNINLGCCGLKLDCIRTVMNEEEIEKDNARHANIIGNSIQMQPVKKPNLKPYENKQRHSNFSIEKSCESRSEYKNIIMDKNKIDDKV